MVWSPRRVASPVPIILLLVAVVVSNPAAAQAVMLAENLRSERVKSGTKNGSGIRARFWSLLVLAQLGPAFPYRKTTLELVLGVAKSGHGSRNTVQCHQFFPRCSWISEAPSYCLSCTHSLSTVKLKPAAYSRTKCSCNWGGPV